MERLLKKTASSENTGEQNFTKENSPRKFNSSSHVFLSSSPLLDHSRKNRWKGWNSWYNHFYQNLVSDPAIVYSISIFITHRLLLTTLGMLFAFFVPAEPPLGAFLLRDVNPYFNGPEFLFLAPFQRWDTNWYIQIAQAGYSVGSGNTNFPPLYPFLVGILGRLLLGQYMLASLIISNLSYVVSLVYLYRLTLRHFNEKTARNALLALAVFPTGFFLASGYTESLYLALSLAAFYYAEDKKWYLASALAALSGITRIQGVILVLPLAYLYFQQKGFKWRKIGWDGLALLLSPALFGLYMAWVYFILSDQNFGNHLLVIWHIKFATPWESFFGGLTGFFDPSHSRSLIYNVFDLICLTLFISLTIIWWQRKLPFHYLLYCILSLTVYLTRQGTEDFFWMSMARYVTLLFPGFMLLGTLATPRFLKISAGLQLVWASFFVFWMWAG